MSTSGKELDLANGGPDERETSLLLGALKGLAVAKKKETLLKKTPTNRHNRTVSWGGNAGPPSMVDQADDLDQSFDGMSQVTQPALDDPESSPPTSPKRTGWKKISLKDIIGSSPLESEAESYIQRSLEEADPTRAGTSESQRSILSGVPDDVKHTFSLESEEETARSAQGIEDASHETDPIDNTEYNRRAPVSTADKLSELAADLNRMRSQNEAMLSSTFEPTSQSDAFAHDAAAILSRIKNGSTSTGETSPTQKVETAATGGGAKSNWKKVRQTVQVAGAIHAGSHKKTDEEVVDPGGDGDVEAGSGVKTEETPGGHNRRNSTFKKMKKTKEIIKSDLNDFKDFWMFRKGSMVSYIKSVLLFVIIPATGIAALLFYAADNPPCGVAKECLADEIRRNETLVSSVILNITQEQKEAGQFSEIFNRETVSQASVSWWLLFIFCRQVTTFTFAKMSEALIIDFFCLRSTLSIKTLGPFLTLFIVQSKGWPFTLFCWGLNNLCFLYGKHPFARHWLFWQDTIEMFNATNPAGSIVESETYLRFLAIGLGVSFMVAMKRFWVGLFLGRQTFSQYANDLTRVMKKNLLIGQVAALARDMEKLFDNGVNFESHALGDSQVYRSLLTAVNEEGSVGESATGPQVMKSMKAGLSDVTAGAGGIGASALSDSQKLELNQLLGAFEEPRSVNSKNENIKISDIIQFRHSLSFLNTAFPFSVAFGPADTREKCIAATENVFHRLTLNEPGSTTLQFDTLALLAVLPDGSMDKAKLTDLVRLFRPDRSGNLSLVDFAKCVDSCYKELRLLRASVANSSRIDKALERILNILFYFILGCIVLSVLGIDPLVLFASVSGFILGFAFMIGSACSKYFEGLLLILVRRPYNIGDRIAVSDVNSDTSSTGSTSWYVRDVTLYSTTVVLAATNEMATYSNGSLASSRIINAARSPQAFLYFLLKFPIDTPYEKLKVFRGCLEKFVTARPREWMSMSAFRATRVEADLGFVEYIVVGQHRESWQNVGALLNSKADLSSFALELTKKMNMRYKSPPLPVDLSVMQRQGASFDMPMDLMNAATATTQEVGGGSGGGGGHVSHESHSSVDYAAIAAMFDKK